MYSGPFGSIKMPSEGYNCHKLKVSGTSLSVNFLATKFPFSVELFGAKNVVFCNKLLFLCVNLLGKSCPNFFVTAVFEMARYLVKSSSIVKTNS